MAEAGSDITIQLPLTELYSDLRLACEGNEFRVHKLVVCLQSPVLASVCEDESNLRTDTIYISLFKTATTKRVIDYLYTKDYVVTLVPYNKDKLEADAKWPLGKNLAEEMLEEETLEVPGQQVSNGGMGEAYKNNRPHKVSMECAVLIRHVRVNAMAGHYGIPPLQKLANEKIKTILQENWSEIGFSSVIKEVFTSTPDGELRDIITSSAADHIDALIQLDDFTGTFAFSHFALALMRKTNANYNDRQTELKSKIDSLDERVSHLSDQLSLCKQDTVWVEKAQGNDG